MRYIKVISEDEKITSPLGFSIHTFSNRFSTHYEKEMS